MDLKTALRHLNEAAYQAIRTGNDTVEYPMLNREKLREIARLTDEMVEKPNVEDRLNWLPEDRQSAAGLRYHISGRQPVPRRAPPESKGPTI